MTEETGKLNKFHIDPPRSRQSSEIYHKYHALTK